MANIGSRPIDTFFSEGTLLAPAVTPEWEDGTILWDDGSKILWDDGSAILWSYTQAINPDITTSYSVPVSTFFGEAE